MLTSELDYELPPELIAQHPLVPRDHSRLLVYRRDSQKIEHRRLTDLPSFLSPGDALVYNDSRVLRARVHALKPMGGKVELLFLKRQGIKLWEALVKPSARLKEGMRLELEPAADNRGPAPEGGNQAAHLQLKQNLGEGRWLVANLTEMNTEDLLERTGEMPLPPYIHQRLQEPERYQTVYAERPGSAAAPTAGLHFTPELIGRISAMGVSLLPMTLHIGLDTFRPIGEDEVEIHEIHSEHYSMPPRSYQEALEARKRGGRIMAVGTTAVRVLETVFQDGETQPGGKLSPPGSKTPALEGDTRLFITPGFRFSAVDALLTNFHLPRSTLLALVMAFAGVPEVHRLYSEAVRERYRFFSFGDAMLLL